MQAKCLETGETVAIKKVLQDKRYKNRELQTMRLLDHPNVVSLKHCFFSTTEKDELYLNLVLEYVPETVYRVARHYSKANQRMPMIYVKLYTYQVCNLFIFGSFIWLRWYMMPICILLGGPLSCLSLSHEKVKNPFYQINQNFLFSHIPNTSTTYTHNLYCLNTFLLASFKNCIKIIIFQVNIYGLAYCWGLN